MYVPASIVSPLPSFLLRIPDESDESRFHSNQFHAAELFFQAISRIQSVLTMVHDTQNYWTLDFVNRPVLKTRTQHFGNWILFRPQVKGRRLICSETDPVSETQCSSF
jgi:hypothetical protein